MKHTHLHTHSHSHTHTHNLGVINRQRQGEELWKNTASFLKLHSGAQIFSFCLRRDAWCSCRRHIKCSSCIDQFFLVVVNFHRSKYLLPLIHSFTHLAKLCIECWLQVVPPWPKGPALLAGTVHPFCGCWPWLLFLVGSVASTSPEQVCRIFHGASLKLAE